MNALLAAYASDIEDEEDDVVRESTQSASQQPETDNILHPRLKRRRPISEPEVEASSVLSRVIPNQYAAARTDLLQFPVRGLPRDRYVSKRERAAASLSDAPTTPAVSAPVHPSSVMKDVLNAEIPYHIQKQLRNIIPDAINYNRLPRGLVSQLQGHTKGVNVVRWSPTHVSLLASAGMDYLAIVWNVWNGSGEQLVRKFNSHTAAVKDVQWSGTGDSLLTCGFDKTCKLIDVESGSNIEVFSDNQFINVVKFHPLEDRVFLSGGSQGALKLWDIRTRKPVKEFAKCPGQIMDVDFSPDGKRFVSTSDIAKRHVSDKTIVVWDYNSEIALSNQVYLEAYTCPCVRYHPFEQSFIAQSNANYIAIFSARPPFKMDKYKRFEGHQVSAYRIQCNFSPCGGSVVTGSADGCFYIYSYRSSKLLRRVEAHHLVCTDVSYHPVLPSVMASCSWDGLINIYQ